MAIAGNEPEQALGAGAHHEAGEHVRGPVRQQDDTREHEPGADTPHDIPLLRRKPGRGRRERADMDGVTRRERIQAFAGEWNAVQMPTNRRAVRALLIEQGFQQMRRDRDDDRGQQDVIAIAPPFG